MALKNRVFIAAAVPLLVVDRITKIVAFNDLQPPNIPHEVFGSVLRFTLVFNRGAAMNLTLGAWSRWGFAAIAVAGIAIMLRMLRLSAPGAVHRATALGLVAAGAAGNLIDRLRWDRGVVDFIDVGIGMHRFWTFNAADAGVTIGAILLALSFSRERPSAPSIDA